MYSEPLAGRNAGGIAQGWPRPRAETCLAPIGAEREHREVTPSPSSTPDFKRGRYLGLIVAVVVTLLGIIAVLALSGVFTPKQKVAPRDPYEDNKEGGCPCNCDRSKAMAAELRVLGGEGALRSIDKSLATIAEREEAGYVTEAMILHRLRLLDVEREMQKAGTLALALHPRPLPFSGIEHQALRQVDVDAGRLRVGMQLAVHGQTTEWVANKQKLQLACFVLQLEVENVTDAERVVKKPAIVSRVSFPISRWYVRSQNGEPWDGKLGARERKSVHVIGYLGSPISPKTEVEARIEFESSTFRAKTRARSRWDRIEPTFAAL